MKPSTLRLIVPRGQKGQGLPEYALIIALVGAAAIVMLMFVSDSMSGMLTFLGNAL